MGAVPNALQALGVEKCDENVSDIGTEPLSAPDFERHRVGPGLTKPCF